MVRSQQHADEKDLEKLDESLEAWRKIPLGGIVCPYLITWYAKVRMDGQLWDVAGLIHLGWGRSGHQCVLGALVLLSKPERRRRLFLAKLSSGGLVGGVDSQK